MMLRYLMSSQLISSFHNLCLLCNSFGLSKQLGCFMIAFVLLCFNKMVVFSFSWIVAGVYISLFLKHAQLWVFHLNYKGFSFQPWLLRISFVLHNYCFVRCYWLFFFSLSASGNEGLADILIL